MKGILVKQHDVSDCGAACIASIAAYYKLYVPVMKIRQLAGTSKSGTSIKGMMEAAEKLKLQSKAVRSSNFNFSSVQLPAIFHLIQPSGGQHFIVVYSIKKKTIRYMDPATGTMINLKSTTLPGWTGVTLMLFPANNFERGDLKKSIFSELIKLLNPYRYEILQTTIASILYATLGLVIALYVQKIVDDILPNKSIEEVNFILLLMLIILCLRSTIGFIHSQIIHKTALLINTDLILGYFRHVMKLPQTFFDNMLADEIISRVNDASQIRTFIHDFAFRVLTQMLTVIFGIIYMIVYQWRLALVIIVSIPVYASLYQIKSRACSNWRIKIMSLSTHLDTQLKETINGISTIKQYRTENDFKQKSERILSPLMTSVYKSDCCGQRISFSLELITCFWTVSILWLGFRFVINGQLSWGELVSYYTLIGFLTNPVLSIFRAYRSVQKTLLAAERLFEIFDLETEKDAGLDLRQLNALPEGDLVQ